MIMIKINIEELAMQYNLKNHIIVIFWYGILEPDFPNRSRQI